MFAQDLNICNWIPTLLVTGEIKLIEYHHSSIFNLHFRLCRVGVSGVREQMTEGRKQKTDDRRQKSNDRIPFFDIRYSLFDLPAMPSIVVGGNLPSPIDNSIIALTQLALHGRRVF
jgi:hypothetical protein